MEAVPPPSSPCDPVSRALAGYVPRPATDTSHPAVRPAGGEESGSQREADGQEQILGAVTLDRDLRIVTSNLAAPAFSGLSPVPGQDFAALLPAEDVPTVTRRLRQVIETREAHVARVQHLRLRDGSDLVVSMSILPAPDRPDGLTVSLIAMAKRLHLYASAAAIGTSLDIGETAQSLARSLLPWGDVAAVDLDYAVWTGEAVAEQAHEDIRLRRAALEPDRAWPDGYLTTGDNLPQEAGRLLAGAAGRLEAPATFVLPDREAIEQAVGDPRLVRALVPAAGPLTVVCIPLTVEGTGDVRGPVVLGVAQVWRRPDRPFGDSELLDLHELVAKTARHVDLARQHQREHAQVLALQRRLLPRAGSDTIEVASVYQPTTPDSAGVGGDFLNSFPLPGGRTALVVGDVVGHGLRAAAAMGQLSMEARALLSAGLGPAEVLACLDQTVTLLDDTETGLAAGYSALGSTCCIAVYDPVEHRVEMSSAGHLPPVLVRPDGTAEVLGARPHPGLGTQFAVHDPFAVHTFAAPPGSVFALYTDGLVEDSAAPIDEGIGRLTDTIRDIHPWDDLQRAARRTVDVLTPHGARRDDVTLMLARMSGRPARDTVTWNLPADDTAPGRARALTASQLGRWHTGGPARDGALLVVSELTSNAVRFGSGPVTLRLIRTGRRLVCEIADSGTGRPRLRHADALDDSGRGLLLVQHSAVRWGVRWTEDGKITWAELETHTRPTGTAGRGAAR